MSGPFGFAGAIPEVNFIPAIFAKEGFDCRGQWDEHVLKGIDFGLKDLPCCDNGIGDDGNVMDVVYFHGRDEASVNSHEFSFERCNVYRVDL